MWEWIEKWSIVWTEKEPQSFEVAKIIAMKRDELMILISQWWIEIQVLKAQQVRSVIAKLMNISPSHILWKKRNSTPKVLRAIWLYVYILKQKLRMSQKEIHLHYKWEVSNATISRWIEKWRSEVLDKQQSNTLYNSIKHIWF